MGSIDSFWNDRMKTARRRKRLQKEDFEKKLIALYIERQQLTLQIRNLGYEPLIPPVQKGWKRIFELRDDLRRSSRAEFFEELLKKINTVQFSDKKQFKVRKRKRGKKIYVDREQKVQSFYIYEFQKLKLTDAQAFYFTERLLMDQRGKWYSVYEFNEPWRFVLKVVPNMITLLQVKDSLLEQKESAISNYLERNNLQGKLERLLYGNRKYRRCKDKKLRYANPLLNVPLQNLIEEYYEV